MMRLLSQNIERLLDQRQMSMNELSKRAGLGQTGIADILSGKVRSTRLETVEKIAGALGVTVADLLSPAARAAAEREMLAAFLKLPAEDQDRLIKTAEA